MSETDQPGGKAPHRIVINDGGAEAAPAAQAPSPNGAAPQEPPQAPYAAREPEPGPFVMEAATVEALIAEQLAGQAKRELLLCLVASAALVLAALAFRRTTEPEDGD